MKWLILVMLVACACPSKKTEAPAGGGTGAAGTSGSGGSGGAGPAATACDAARSKVEQLYRAEAQAKEPKRVDEAVADNTAMVMKDCAKDPAKLVACINGAATVKDLETSCLAPIDDEGTEGERAK